MRWAVLAIAPLACGCGIAFSAGEPGDGGGSPTTTSSAGGADGAGGSGGVAVTGPGGAPTGTPTGVGGRAEEGGGGSGGQDPTSYCAPTFEESFSTNVAWSGLTNGTGGEIYYGRFLTLSSGTFSTWIVSDSAYPLTPCGVAVETTQPPNNGGGAWFDLADAADFNDRASFLQVGSVLVARYIVSGQATTLAEGPYDPVAHRWWRLRRTSTAVIWDVSSDGVTWNEWHSEAAPSWGAGNNNFVLGVTNVAGSTTALFDNLAVYAPTQD